MSGATLRVGPSRQPSVASTNSVLLRSSSPTPGYTQPAQPPAAASQRFRKLTWDATIPIAVTVEASDLVKLGGNANRSVETFYLRAPRVSYLPLILQEVRQGLLTLMLDFSDLESVKEEDIWFTYEGVPLRWHWPIGLLYDYHTANTAPSAHERSVASTSQSSVPGGVQTLTSSLRKLSTAPSSNDGHAAQYKSTAAPVPWCITLRFGEMPAEKLHSVAGVSNCRSSFMSMVKEADFVRYGSTKRVTNLRRTEQDALWDGVLQHDFDAYWSVAEKLIPLAPTSLDDPSANVRSPSRTPSISNAAAASTKSSLTHHTNESLSSLHSTAVSDSGASVSDNTPSTTTKTAYRSVPMRFHLTGGAPVVQEPASPFADDGRPITLHAVLSSLFPLLFPPTPTFSTSAAFAQTPPPLAYAVIQGIRVPLDTEIAWIGSVLPFADGWYVMLVINTRIDTNSTFFSSRSGSESAYIYSLTANDNRFRLQRIPMLHSQHSSIQRPSRSIASTIPSAL